MNPGEDPDKCNAGTGGSDGCPQSKTASPDGVGVSPVVDAPAPTNIIDFSYVVAWNELQKAPPTREEKIQKAIRESNARSEQKD